MKPNLGGTPRAKLLLNFLEAFVPVRGVGPAGLPAEALGSQMTDQQASQQQHHPGPPDAEQDRSPRPPQQPG
ncbi:hypothetical protein [Salinibacter ruber]|uniref:hypothetical protein n=1 Tax=Salinibacter ruber TaxID=146919 RepID=UPI0021684F90